MRSESGGPVPTLHDGHISVAALLLAAISVSACVTPPSPAPLNPVPVAVSSLPLDLEPVYISKPDDSPRPPAVRMLEATRVSLKLQDADLASVLLGLGHDSPLNVVVDPGVVGKLTADLQNVSLLDALDHIVTKRGYRYSLDAGVLRVSPIGSEMRIYRVDYPNYSRMGTSDVALAGFIGAAPSIGEAGASSAGDTSLSRVTTTHRADFWTEIEQAVRTIVFGSPDATADIVESDASGEPAPSRRVFVSRQSAVVSVTAEPAILEAVDRYFEAVAESLEYQVLINTQFVEITLGDDLDLGIDYEVAIKEAGVFARMITPGLNTAAVVQSFAPTLTEGGLQLGFAKGDFGAILRAIATQTDVRVVSTPRITTLNNHKAVIKVVRNEVFFIGEVETVATQSAVIQTTEFRPHIIPVGVTLDVTPQISSRSEVTLHIRASVSEIVDVKFQPTSDPNLPQNGSLPVVDLREADMVVRVPDGTPIAIGGLIRTREIEKELRVPGLGSIPGLGALFRRLDSQELRTELVIFMTPHVLDPPRIEQITEALGANLAAIDDLRGERAVWPWWRRPYLQSYGNRGGR